MSASAGGQLGLSSPFATGTEEGWLNRSSSGLTPGELKVIPKADGAFRFGLDQQTGASPVTLQND